MDGIDIAADRQIISKYGLGIAAVAQLGQLNAELVLADKELQKSQALVNEATQGVAGWSLARSEREAPAEAAQAKIAAYEADMLRFNQFVMLDKERLDLESRVFPELQIELLPELAPYPSEPEKHPRLEEAIEKLDALKAGFHAASETLSGYVDRRIGVCNICGHSCSCCEAANGGPLDEARVAHLTAAKDQAWASLNKAKGIIDQQALQAEQWGRLCAEQKAAFEATRERVTISNSRKESERNSELLVHQSSVKRVLEGLAACTVRQEPSLDMRSLQTDIDLLTQAITQHQHWKSTLQARTASLATDKQKNPHPRATDARSRRPKVPISSNTVAGPQMCSRSRSWPADT